MINKIDLAPHVGANLAVMEADTRRMRGQRPWCFTNLRTGEGVEDFLLGQLPPWRLRATPRGEALQ